MDTPTYYPDTIIDDLSRAIGQRDPEYLARSLVDFIHSFYLDPDDLERVEDSRRSLERQFGVSEELSEAMNRRHLTATSGITGILKTFDNEDPNHLFGFHTGTSGQRLYFNGRDNQVKYTGGQSNGALERFVDLYGGPVVQLNILSE